MSKLEAVARIAASLAMTGYILWLFLRRRERKVPPCETCKRLEQKRRDYPRDKKIWLCEHDCAWHGPELQFCNRYSPRDEEGEGGEQDE